MAPFANIHSKAAGLVESVGNQLQLCLHHVPSIQQESHSSAHTFDMIGQALRRLDLLVLMQALLQGHLSSQLQHRGLSHPHRQPFHHLQQQLLVSWLRGGLPKLRPAVRSMPDQLQKTHAVIKPGQQAQLRSTCPHLCALYMRFHGHRCCAAPHDMQRHFMLQHSMAQNLAAQHSAAQHSTAQRSTAQHSTAYSTYGTLLHTIT